MKHNENIVRPGKPNRVVYGPNGHVKSLPRNDRFADLGPMSPVLDKQYQEQLAKLNGHISVLQYASAHSSIEFVRKLNKLLDSHFNPI